MPTGQEIICLCTSCKLELRHVIVAHKSGNSGPIAKVRCNTCGKIHAYRASQTEKDMAAAKVRRASATPRVKAVVVPIEVEWQEQLRSKQGKASKAYAPVNDYATGDVIEHPSFGLGVVKSVKEGNKIDVIFQRDVKVLIHRMKMED
jgi:hypothetical protein